MHDLFRQIRSQCADVAENARWVKIDYNRLGQYPETLLLNPEKLRHSPEHHLLGRKNETLTFFVILDSLNFGSGYFPHLSLGAERWGYHTFAKRLKEHCEKVGIPSAEELRNIDAEGCARIFRLSNANLHTAELMQLFALALNQLGEWIMTTHRGDYLGFLRKSKSVDAAVTSLLEMRFFRDVATYGATDIPFLKRAQLLLHDMRIAEPDHELLGFEDFGQLTIFADNVIPFVLKADRVLQYDQWLERRIQNEELIGSGSMEEIEMRACSLHAVEILRDIVSEELREITSGEIDYCLWNRGQVLKAMTSEKRHRTRCVYY
jgi:hypothetical protein